MRKSQALMKLSHILKCSILGLALLCSSIGSFALTLGRMRGAAVLGQPLLVTVPVQIAADEDASNLCFEADVFYGDNQQDSKRVSVSNETPRLGVSGLVRIQVYAPVDEPIVTLHVRSGCGQQTNRRYVLLADLASEVAPSVLVRPTVASDTVPVIAQATALGVMGNIAGRPLATHRRRTAEAAPKPNQRIPSAGADSVVPKPTTKRGSVGKPRLTLAVLDPAQELEPILKMSAELTLAPVEDMKGRQEAAAIWRALNASPEDLLRDENRVLVMAREVKHLQEQTSQNHQLMLDLAGRLEKAQSQRFANPLTYALTVALLLCGFGLAYGWSRWRDTHLVATPWWRGKRLEDDLEEGGGHGRATDEGHLGSEQHSVLASDTALSREPDVAVTNVDIDLQLADSAFSDLGKPSPSQMTALEEDSVGRVTQGVRSSPRDFVHSATSALREINSQEMLDARQQADFFMTLGQYDEAIDVLERCIRDSGEPNPLVYLDLLHAFHTLSRKTDYDRYRARFNQLFTGRIPEYTDFNETNEGIENYPDICERIAKLWPSEDALTYIETCLVRTPEKLPAVEFDLEAYRDLLMLHGVVWQITSLLHSGLQTFSTLRAHAPLPESLSKASAAFAVMPATPSSELVIDLDLSEPVNNSIEFDAAQETPLLPIPKRS